MRIAIQRAGTAAAVLLGSVFGGQDAHADEFDYAYFNWCATLVLASYEVTGDEDAMGIGLDTCYEAAGGTIAAPDDGWGFAETSIALGAEIDTHTTVIGTMKGEIAKIAENTAAQGRQIEAMGSRIKEIEGRLAAVETLTAQIEALPMVHKQLEAQQAKLQELEQRVSTP